MIVLYFIIISLFGYFSLRVFNKFKLLLELNTFEKIGFSILIGSLFFTLYEFILSIIGIKYNFYIIIPIFILSIVGMILLIISLMNSNYSIKNVFKNKILILLVISLVLILGYYGLVAYSNNLLYPDEFSYWGLNAKNIFIGGRVNFFINTGLEKYPDFLPLLYSGYYVFVNSVSENAIRVIPTFLFVGFIFSFLGLSKKHNIKLEYSILAIILTILLYSGLTTYMFSTYADTTFASFFTLSILYLLEWMLYNRKEGFILSILFANASCWVKLDGVAMLLINIGLIVLYIIIQKLYKKETLKKLDISRVIIYIISIFLIGIIWYVYKKVANFPTVLEAGAGSRLEFNIQWLIPLLTNMSLQQFSDVIWSSCLTIFLVLIYTKYVNFDISKKIYIIFAILAIFATMIFLMLCYLVVFGYEALSAASYIRYLVRVIFIFEFVILLMISNK